MVVDGLWQLWLLMTGKLLVIADNYVVSYLGKQYDVYSFVDVPVAHYLTNAYCSCC